MENKYDFMFLQETWLEKNCTDLFLDYKVESINAVRTHRVGRASGGLLLLYKSKFNLQVIASSRYWIFVLAESMGFKFVLGAVYFNEGLTEERDAEFQDILQLLEEQYEGLEVVVGETGIVE